MKRDQRTTDTPNPSNPKQKQQAPAPRRDEPMKDPEHKGCVGKDCVEEASEESFPASDPPSFTPTKST